MAEFLVLCGPANPPGLVTVARSFAELTSIILFLSLASLLLACWLIYAARVFRAWSHLRRGSQVLVALYLIAWATLVNVPLCNAVVWHVFGGSAHFAESGRGPDGRYYLVSGSGEKIQVSKATYRAIYWYQYWSFWGPAVVWWSFFVAAGAYRWRRSRAGSTIDRVEEDVVPFPFGRL